MYPDRLEKEKKHPHWSVDDIFGGSKGPVRGFVQRDYRIGMHEQDFYEIHIVLGGHGEHYIGERHTPVREGDVFIIPPNVSHGYEGGVGFDVYHIVLRPGFLEKNSSELQSLPHFSALFRTEPFMRERTAARLHLHLDRDELFALRPRLDELAGRSGNDAPHDIILSSCNALMVISSLCTAYDGRLCGGAGEDEQFARSLSYIYENYGGRILVSELSRIAGMSRTAYIEKFKEITGKTPGAFIALHRVMAARELIVSTSEPIEDISVRVGFYDASHLTRTFLKHIGKTPSELRKSLK